MKASIADLRRVYISRFDLSCPLIVTLNPTPEEQTLDLPKRMSDLSAATLRAIVDRVNEDVPETPAVAASPEEASGEEEEQERGKRMDINAKLEAVAQSSPPREAVEEKRDRHGNLPLEAELSFANSGACQRLHMDFSMDYALKMRKFAAVAAAAAAAQREGEECRKVDEMAESNDPEDLPATNDSHAL